MAFRFSLAALLRLRESIERQRSLRLQQASMEVARVQDELARLDQFLTDSALSDQADLAHGSSAAELQFAVLIRSNLNAVRNDLHATLRELETKRQQVADEYQRAFRERESLETLRTRQKRAYEQDTERRAQRAIDAAHLLQRWRNRAG